MPAHFVDESPSVSSLVGGIVEDARRLFQQEAALARNEIREEWTKAKTAAVSFAAGGVVLGLAGLLLTHGLVYLLHWLTNGSLPLWGCYAIIGGLLACVGILLFAMARSEIKHMDFVPHRTVESMKENVQWLKRQT